MYYTYVLESISHPGNYYVGYSININLRLRAHNHGKNPSTKQRRPWKVKASFAFESKELALNFERYLKTGSGHAFRRRHFGM